MDRVFLRGLQFYGYHGVHEEETRLGQRFEVDIDAEIDLHAAGRTDDLRNTINYSDLFELAKGVVEGDPRNLIEAVAEAIATRGLSQYPMIESIMVEIRKPSAPVKSGGIDYVGVSVYRTRADLDHDQPNTATGAGAKGQ